MAIGAGLVGRRHPGGHVDHQARHTARVVAGAIEQDRAHQVRFNLVLFQARLVHHRIGLFRKLVEIVFNSVAAGFRIQLVHGIVGAQAGGLDFHLAQAVPAHDVDDLVGDQPRQLGFVAA